MTIIGDAQIEVTANVSGFARDVASKVGAIGGTIGSTLTRGLVAGFGTLAVQAASGLAVQGVAGLVSAVETLGPALAVLPAAGLVAAGGLATLGVALHGVGDGLKAALAGDPAKLSKALQGMAPAAQEAIRAVAGLRPQLIALQQSVQGALFTGLAPQIKALGAQYLGPLRDDLTGIASRFHDVAGGVLDFARQGATLGVLRTALHATGDAVGSIGGAVPAVLTALRDVVAVGLPYVQQAAGGIGKALSGIAGRIDTAATSGRLTQLIDGALGLLRQLGTIAGNVGGILASVFTAAQATGGGFLNTVTTVTGQVDALLKSAQGQTALAAFFQTSAQAAGILTSVLAAVLPAVQPVAQVLSSFATAAADVLVPALAQIGPALQGLGPTAAVLGQAFGGLIATLAPVLPVVAQVARVLADNLAAALVALQPAVGPVVTAFGQVLTALAPVVPVLVTALVPALVGAAQAAAALAPAVAAVATGAAPVVPVLAAIGIALAALPVTAAVSGFASLASRISGVFSGLQAAQQAVTAAQAGVTASTTAVTAAQDAQTLSQARLSIATTVQGQALARQAAVQATAGVTAEELAAAQLAVERANVGVMASTQAATGATQRLAAANAEAAAASAGLAEAQGATGIIGLLGPIGLVVGAVAILALGFAFLYLKFEPVRAAVHAFTDSLMGTLVPGLKIAAGIFLGVVAPAMDKLRQVFSDNRTQLVELGHVVGTVVGVIASTFAGIAGLGLGVIFDVMAAAVVGVVKVLGQLVTAGESVAGFVNTVIGFFEHLYDVILGHSIIPDLVNGIILWIGGLPGAVFGVLAGFVTGVVGFFTGLAGSVIGAAASLVTGVVGWYVSMVGQVVGFVVGLVGQVVGLYVSLATSVVSTVAGFVGSVVGFFAGLVGQVVSFVVSMVTRVVGFYVGFWSQAASIFAGGVATVVGFLASLPGRAVGAIAGLGGALAGVGSAAMSALGGAISSGIGGALSSLGGIAGRALSAVGNLSGTLVGVGEALMSGLASGITGALHTALSAIASAGSQILSAAKSAFHIGSPSRLFRDEVGAMLPLGLALGVKDTTGDAVAATRRMVAQVTAAATAVPGPTGSSVPGSAFVGRGGNVYTVNLPGPVSSELTAGDVIAGLRTLDALLPVA